MSLPPISAPADRDGCICASVCVGEQDTPYVRAGRGAPVVLLEEVAAEQGTPLVGALSAHFRVLAPRGVPTGDGFSPWLRGFLDGLGVESVTLVVGSPFAADALRFAAEEPTSVRSVVLLGQASTYASLARPLLLQPSDEAPRVTAAIAPFIALHA